MFEVDVPDEVGDKVESVRHLVEVWARHQKNNALEIRKDLWYASLTAEGRNHRTNWMVSEEDSGRSWEVMQRHQSELVEAAMEDLSPAVPWAYWAIMKRNDLGSMGLFRYERLAPGGKIPPGLYTNALVEFVPYCEGRGLLL